MTELPKALEALAKYNQFILWTRGVRNGKALKYPVGEDVVLGPDDKLVKLPIDYNTTGVGDAQSPSIWMDSDKAFSLAESYGPLHYVGFVFTKDDPFFFLDIDKCLNPDNQTWSPVAVDIMNRLPGAAVEVSQSKRGLHIFGKSVHIEHGCKNIPLGLELYTEGRFVALTGTNVVGDANRDMSAELAPIVSSYFSGANGAIDLMEWTDTPVANYTVLTDEEIISKAMGSGGAAGVFQGKSNFQALWEADADILAQYYPDLEGSRSYDESSADAALAQYLAFWTGKNCERIKSLMLMSALVRDKWDREDYLPRTITRAASLQTEVYSVGQVDTTVPDKYEAVTLRGSKNQKEYAISIRAEKMAQCQDNVETCTHLSSIPSAKVWIDLKAFPPEEIKARTTQIESAPPPTQNIPKGPELLSGYQYLGVTQQLEYLKGCVYVQGAHKILTPTGLLLKSEQFNATYGGYIFQMDENGDKVTRKAFEAFTESQLVRFPKVEETCFRPDLAAGDIIEHEGLRYVNSYVPIETRRVKGDITPFTAHLAKLLPNERDRTILLSFMAACVQHKGVKFQWAPLIQGVEGNGKTLLTRCVSFAIGERYTHLPPANDISEKFNSWLFNKLFIGVEDVYLADHKSEVMETLKPMITNDRLSEREMQRSQVTNGVCANFMLNSNFKDAIRKMRNDRRFAVFYTAQQEAADLITDGMGGDYFPNLYRWLKKDGYAIVNEYLSLYVIADEFNPATDCQRAPNTSSTEEAITSSMGGVEQCIIEAIEEGRPGFAGGWVSSVALDRLLSEMKMTRAISPNKRRDLLKQLGYDWHPALDNGRTNNPIVMDGNKKPRLFIKMPSMKANILSAAEVARVYQADQCQGLDDKAREVFNAS